MCRQCWLRIKCAFTHTNCKVLQEQQLPLLCSVRQLRPAWDVLLPASQVWLQISSWCCMRWLFRQLWGDLCCLHYSWEPGQKPEKHCILQEGKAESGLTSNCTLWNAAQWWSRAGVHCTALQRKAELQQEAVLFLTVDTNSTRLLYCEALLKN